MTIEQKTEFLTNLDKKHQFFVSMPHMNAGKYNDDDFVKNIQQIVNVQEFCPCTTVRPWTCTLHSRKTTFHNLSDFIIKINIHIISIILVTYHVNILSPVVIRFLGFIEWWK